MSGPKVVRVVTREELVAAGTLALARLDAAVSQWKLGCGDVKLADLEATKERRDELAAMLAADRFAEFGQAAAKEIDFLEADAARRRERAAQVRAQERLRQSSGQELARTLLRAGADLNQQVRAELEQAATGLLSVGEMDAALSRARQALFQVPAQGASAEQKILAQRLGGSETDTSFEAWRAKASKPDVRLQSVFTHLAELEALGFADAGELEAQLRAVQAIENESTRDMRLDTLVLALRKTKDGALAKMKLLRQVEGLNAELSAIASESETLAKLRSATLRMDLEHLQVLVALGREELAKTQAAFAAAARRNAVLGGLQKLGYQVQEGLATVTPDSGRLVVRSPSRSDYGVEVVTGANHKLQVRSVAFDATRDASQDIAEERRWCGDFGKLQATLQASGCEVVLEKALGVGAVPLRVVEVVAEHRRRQASSGETGRSR
ncbi:hypothetical protein [Hydrogenophaga sp.]|uniref:hypothetical protein n=1 Tax=Hydrogenophaga sp. TaxID=1904254 RepID=UPI00286E6C28|nr:hypothetical protein [Hydrogenophaga sp.]